MSGTQEKAAQPIAELRQRMAKHLTALVFAQIDNNGEWMVHQEYTEELVDFALADWRQQFEAVSRDRQRDRAAGARNRS